MRVRLHKQAEQKLKKLFTSDLKTAKRIQQAIYEIRDKTRVAESLAGHPDYKKTRVGKYRIITTVKNDDNGDILYVVILEKRETVYKTFDHFMKTNKA